jgi:hypothetical protein
MFYAEIVQMNKRFITMFQRFQDHSLGIKRLASILQQAPHYFYHRALAHIEYILFQSYTLELAEEYSRDVLSPGYGNDQQHTYRYMQLQSVLYTTVLLHILNIFCSKVIRLNCSVEVASSSLRLLIAFRKMLNATFVYTESKGQGTDLMQSSESAYGSRGKIISQQESIESGVKHFAV